LAHKHGKDIAFSLSDPFCVERHHDAFRELIEEYVTILFANEDEARALFQVKEFGTAVEMAADRCRIACITRGNNGSVIAAGVNRHSIDAITDITVVDTTGAGDLYAGGFLYGYIHGYNLQRSGQIATLCSTEIIQHIGARPKSDLKKTLGTL
jgi:sugar/nucleoside kinase (ribokinase family)